MFLDAWILTLGETEEYDRFSGILTLRIFMGEEYVGKPILILRYINGAYELTECIVDKHGVISFQTDRVGLFLMLNGWEFLGEGLGDMKTRGGIVHGYIDSELIGKTDLTRHDLDMMDLLYQRLHTTEAGYELMDANTGTVLWLPNEIVEAARNDTFGSGLMGGSISGSPPKLVVEPVSEEVLGSFQAPDGQIAWESADVSLMLGDQPLEPDTFEGMTLSFAMLRKHTQWDEMRAWWNGNEWAYMPCPPNFANTIDFETVEALGPYVITLNEAALEIGEEVTNETAGEADDEVVDETADETVNEVADEADEVTADEAGE
jgi:hypothetical protein